MNTRLINLLAGELLAAFGLGVWLLYLGYRKLPGGESATDPALLKRRLFYKALGALSIMAGILGARNTVLREKQIETSRVLTWKTFECVDGRFAVLMPGAPEHSHVETKREALPSVTDRFTVALPLCNYVVAYGDLPPDTRQRSPQEVLDQVARMATAWADGMRVEQRARTILGRPGLEYSVDVPASAANGCEAFCDGQIILDGRRVYQLFALSAKSLNREDHHKFFDSFAITPRP